MELQPKIEKDQAQKELSAFIENRFRLPSTKDGLKDVVKSLTEAMMYGLMTIDGTTITQVLLEPIKDERGNVVISEIVYNRIAASERNIAKFKAQKAGENQVNAVASLCTGLPTAVFDKLDVEDMGFKDCIMLFFA